MARLSKTGKRVVRADGRRDRKAARARQLYERVEQGARMQVTLQNLSERRFFDPRFDSQQLVEKAKSFKGLSRRQRIELSEYAKRLARKRDSALKKFRKWGLKPEHMGKPLRRTPSGVSAKSLLYQLTGWKVYEPIELIPYKGIIAFNVGTETYNTISRAEFPKDKIDPIAFVATIDKVVKVIITPTIEVTRERKTHEKRHTTTYETPLIQELHMQRKQITYPKKFKQTFRSTDIKLGTKRAGRDLIDELVSNMLEPNGIEDFEAVYKDDLSSCVRFNLGPKTAASFMRNKGGYKSRILDATAASIKTVRSALAAYVVNPRTAKRVKVVSKGELAALLTNIRDMHRIPQRLPVLIELRRKRLKKRLGVK